MTLSDVPVGSEVAIRSVRGERGFRRRLLELGLLPGRKLRVVRVAPLGDPLQLESSGTSLSIRAHEAAQITVVAFEESKG